jgi:hypothetical protein
MASLGFLNWIVLFLIFLVILCVYGICYFLLSLITDWLSVYVLKMGTLIWKPETIKSFINKIKKQNDISSCDVRDCNRHQSR